MSYYKIGTTEQQVNIFFNKYNKEHQKMLNAKAQGNEPMYKYYKKVIDTMKMSLSLLGVHIDGINRPLKENEESEFYKYPF